MKKKLLFITITIILFSFLIFACSTYFSSMTLSADPLDTTTTSLPVVTTTTSSTSTTSTTTTTLANWINIGDPRFSDGAVVFLSLDVYDGTPYVAYVDQENSYKATVKRFTDNTWDVLEQTGFTTAGIDYPKIKVHNGTPYFAYMDGSSAGRMTVRYYDETNDIWNLVGPKGFSAGGTKSTSFFIEDDGTMYVAYVDKENNWGPTVHRYNESTSQWDVIGSTGFTGAGASAIYLSLFVDNKIPYLAYNLDPSGPGPNKASVSMFDATSDQWVNLGDPDFTPDMAIFLNLIKYNGKLHFVYRDTSNNERPAIEYWDNGTWNVMGERGDINESADYINAIVDNNNLYVAYKNSGATVVMYNGTDWVNVGVSDFSDGWAFYISFAMDNGIPYVAYADDAEKDYDATPNHITVMRLE